ncbi:unnamed protein product [Arabis nemorensis]|uniref:Uncharacterized protein n=1 Tax=Arabis nemorensis TaxID=586526 RepID=A0A565BHW0_9BRAS|nr:unnamed protein product [Arabis nemorensis]
METREPITEWQSGNSVRNLASQVVQGLWWAKRIHQRHKDLPPPMSEEVEQGMARCHGGGRRGDDHHIPLRKPSTVMR